MAGTNTDRSPISVRPRTQLEKTGDQLDSYAKQTENMTYVNPFNNFPYENLDPGQTAEDVRRWHPVKHHCSKPENSC